jgi:hypothetical protein
MGTETVQTWHSRVSSRFIRQIIEYSLVVFWENFPKTVGDTPHTGSVMRISDDRYNRERLSLDLALRFLRHEARTQTIRAWTGLSDDRIRKLDRRCVGVLVIVLGSATTLAASALAASAREVHQHTRFAPIQVTVTGLELVQMLLFAGLVFVAITLRRRPDYHKRLMLLTIACFLPSVLARLPGDDGSANLQSRQRGYKQI